MKVSPAGVSLTKQSEALRLFAYPDPASPLAAATPHLARRWGMESATSLLNTLSPSIARLSGLPWTIGYGHTHDVHIDDKVTEHQAEALLEFDLAWAGAIASAHVKVPLTQGMFDALSDFVLNVGPGMEGVKDGFVWLKSGAQSTLLTRLNAGDYNAARAQLLLWTKAGGQVMHGLQIRRQAEFDLWGETTADFSNVQSGSASTAPAQI